MHQRLSIHIGCQPESGDKGEPYGFLRLGQFPEKADSLPQALGVVFINGKSLYGKLHFAKVHYLVPAINDEINLCLLAIAAPRPPMPQVRRSGSEKPGTR